MRRPGWSVLLCSVPIAAGAATPAGAAVLDTVLRPTPVTAGGGKDIYDPQVAQGGVRWLQRGSEFGGFEGFRGSRFNGKGRVSASRPASTSSAAFFGSRVLFVRTSRLYGFDQYTRCSKAGCKVETAPARFR